MITAFVLSPVEICVFLAVAAAAVVALCVKPTGRGAAVTHMVAGTLCSIGEGLSSPASIDFECLDEGNVLLTRRGLKNQTDCGAVSIVVTITGFDVTIEERTVAGGPCGESVDTALFTLDFLAQERYHIRYVSEATASAAAFSLRNRPGMHVSRPLHPDS